MALVCWKCGASLKDLPRPITRHSNCRECYAELHSCLACRHYTTRYTKKCDHDLADPPLRKETANFCDYFKPADDAFKAQQADQAKTADASLRALFGEHEPESQDDAEDPAARLKALFDADEKEKKE